jgi:hypothetical protein
MTEERLEEQDKVDEQAKDHRVVTLGKLLQEAGYEVLSFKYVRRNIELTILPLKSGQAPTEWEQDLWMSIRSALK